MVHATERFWLPRHNLYAGEPSATLATEAARLDHNRRLIARDLAQNPGSWADGRSNLDVLDTLLDDCLAAMLDQGPALIVRVAA